LRRGAAWYGAARRRFQAGYVAVRIALHCGAARRRDTLDPV